MKTWIRFAFIAAALCTTACFSIQFNNGPTGATASPAKQAREWHHDGILNLVEFTRPVDLNNRCGGADWQSVRVYKSFLQGFLQTAASSFVGNWWDPWTVETRCAGATTQSTPAAPAPSALQPAPAAPKARKPKR